MSEAAPSASPINRPGPPSGLLAFPPDFGQAPQVKTDKGDFILDNLVDNIRSWDATGYYFLKRQSQQDPNIWVSINLRGDAAFPGKHRKAVN